MTGIVYLRQISIYCPSLLQGWSRQNNFKFLDSGWTVPLSAQSTILSFFDYFFFIAKESHFLQPPPITHMGWHSGIRALSSPPPSYEQLRVPTTGDKSSGAEGAATNSENLQKKLLGTTSTYSVLQQEAVGLSTGCVRASTLTWQFIVVRRLLKKPWNSSSRYISGWRLHPAAASAHLPIKVWLASPGAPPVSGDQRKSSDTFPVVLSSWSAVRPLGGSSCPGRLR